VDTNIPEADPNFTFLILRSTTFNRLLELHSRYRERYTKYFYSGYREITFCKMTKEAAEKFGFTIARIAPTVMLQETSFWKNHP
jgi:hypothetical protein